MRAAGEIEMRLADGPSRGPRLFLVLSLWCWLAVSGAAAACCALIRPRLAALEPSFAALYLLAALAAAGAALSTAHLVSVMRRGDLFRFPLFAAQRSSFMKLYPFCRRLGRLLGHSEDEVAGSLIALSNRLVLGASALRRGGELLVLVPRCLQHSGCARNILERVTDCQGCGRCDIAALVRLMGRYRFRAAAVTGGQLARKMVRELSPSGVIAIACERELIEGMREITGTPVIGLVNMRPEGPCKNTAVSLEALEDALEIAGARR